VEIENKWHQTGKLEIPIYQLPDEIETKFQRKFKYGIFKTRNVHTYIPSMSILVPIFPLPVWSSISQFFSLVTGYLKYRVGRWNCLCFLESEIKVIPVWMPPYWRFHFQFILSLFCSLVYLTSQIKSVPLKLSFYRIFKPMFIDCHLEFFISGYIWQYSS